MINESLEIHGKKQFEIKQRVSFTKEMKELRYQVETYFFLPAALQINPSTYSSAEFQRSLKNYVRLSPPTHKLHHLASENGPIHQLQIKLEQLKQKLVSTENSSDNKSAPSPLDEYENALKLYALTYKRSLRLAVKVLSKNKQKQTVEDTEKVLESIQKCLETYRALKGLADDIEKNFNSKAFAYCDEYISIITTYYLRDMFLDTAIPLHQEVQSFWKEEINYRQQYYPDSVPTRSNDNETVLYRWRILKKYVSRCLFLEVKLKKGAPLLLHSLYGVAAAISMIFATLVAFLWQGKYGALSINLFYALIIAYIFKDRIKDIAREQLSILFQKWIPDRRLLIYKDDKIPVGVCKESFKFVDEQKLPQDIWKMRQQSHWINLVNDHRAENVMFYKKEVQLHYHSQLFQQTQYSIMDITRFHIIDFIKYIDNMFEELPLIEDEDKMAVGEKIYHIYLIRRVLYAGKAASELARLVINAEGIKRLEIIQPMAVIEDTSVDNLIAEEDEDNKDAQD